MSFIAYNEEEHINKRYAADVRPEEQDHIFYCPNPKCNCKFTVSAFNSNKIRKDLFKEMRKQLYEYKQPVLIYASWNNNQTTIKTKTQIVPLKAR